MENKPFKLGIMVGRFQMIHSGHEFMINRTLEICDEVGIFIGSSQESGTQKNPFSYEIRRDLLKEIYGDKIKIFPLPDIGVGNTSKWGDYVLKNVCDRFGGYPDLIASGKESRRIDWLSSEDGNRIFELYIPKTIEISASEMRSLMIENNFEEWKKYSNPKIWDKFDFLREIVIHSKNNLKTSSI